MMQRFRLLLLLLFPLTVFADGIEEVSDTSVARHFDMEEVTVVGFKQDALGRDPIAVTSLSEAFVHNMEMTSIKDLGYTVPNFYIPEYGSRQTSPVFVRGVGSKTNGPTVGFYIDGVPHMERSSFDDDLFDLSALEVLRGPQGTLYGRNCIGGIINAYTHTPFDFQGTRVKAGYGRYNDLVVNAYNYTKLNDRMGFAVNVAGNNAGHPKSYLGEENYGNTKEGWTMAAVQNMAEYYGTETFLTEALTREALKTLEYPVSHHQPFYLYMAHYATHTPIQKDSRFYDSYADMGLDDGQMKFSSMVEGVDKSLGDLMDYLEDKGIADNTIIIFMADNGGNADNPAKGGVPHTCCAPLREGKGSCYQGGIRVPMMVYWPGKTAPGTRVNTPTMPEDLFPTILQMGGVKDWKTVQNIDGKSLVDLFVKGSQLAGRESFSSQKEANAFVVPESVSGIDPSRELVFHYPHQWKVEYRPEVDFLSTIIKGDWKLVYVMMNTVPGMHVLDGVPFELYNIKEDIGETKNLAAEYPEKVAELAKALGDRLRAWDAPMPVLRSTGEKVAWPDEVDR